MILYSCRRVDVPTVWPDILQNCTLVNVYRTLLVQEQLLSLTFSCKIGKKENELNLHNRVKSVALVWSRIQPRRWSFFSCLSIPSVSRTALIRKPMLKRYHMQFVVRDVVGYCSEKSKSIHSGYFYTNLPLMVDGIQTHEINSIELPETCTRHQIWMRQNLQPKFSGKGCLTQLNKTITALAGSSKESFNGSATFLSLSLSLSLCSTMSPCVDAKATTSLALVSLSAL